MFRGEEEGGKKNLQEAERRRKNEMVAEQSVIFQLAGKKITNESSVYNEEKMDYK